MDSRRRVLKIDAHNRDLGAGIEKTIDEFQTTGLTMARRPEENSDAPSRFD